MLERLIDIDRHLLLALNGSDSLYWDNVMMTVTHTTTWLFVVIALVLVIVRNNNRTGIFLALAGIVLTILIADQFSSTFCKPFFHRLRPSHEPWFGDAVDIVDGYRGGLYGFISSHAANTFGVAVFLSYIVRNRLFTFFLLSWALLCSYSRIYLGVHYPGDILCGALCGIVTGTVVYWLYRYLYRRMNNSGRSYFSSRYTHSGYLINDIYWLEVSLLATYVFILIYSFL